MGISDYKDYSALVLRVILGLILIFHGIGKLFTNAPGMEAFTGLVGTVFPAAPLFAWIVALIEFVGGILILTGLWTRIATALVSVEFIVILLFFVRDNLGFGIGKAELEILILAASIALFLSGTGKWSLEQAWFGEELWD